LGVRQAVLVKSRGRIMKFFWMAAAVLFFSAVSSAETPRDVVDKLFDAMRRGDGAAIAALVEEGARLDRLQKDGTLKHGAFADWISWVDQQQEGDANEQIFGVKILQASPEFATVWAPFVIHYKGKLAGCGINQFTLAKSQDGWRILYGIDMPYKGDCSTYRSQFE